MRIRENLKDLSDKIHERAEEYVPKYELAKKYLQINARALSPDGIAFKEILDFYKASDYLPKIKDVAGKLKNPKTKLSSVVSIEKINEVQKKAQDLAKLCDKPLIESCSQFKVNEATFINNVEEIQKIIEVLENNIGIFEDLAKLLHVSLPYIKSHLNQVRQALKDPKALSLSQLANALAIDYAVPLEYVHNVVTVINTFDKINLKDSFSKLALPNDHVFKLFSIVDQIVKDKINIKLVTDFVQEFYLLTLEYSKSGIASANRIIRLFPKPVYKIILNDLPTFRKVVDVFQKLVQDLQFNNDINQAIKSKVRPEIFDKYVKFLKKLDAQIEQFKHEGLPVTSKLASLLKTDDKTVASFSDKIFQFINGDATFLEAIDWFLPFSTDYLDRASTIPSLISDQDNTVNSVFNKAVDLSSNEKLKKNAQKISKKVQDFVALMADRVPILKYFNIAPSKYSKFAKGVQDTVQSNLWDFFTEGETNPEATYDKFMKVINNLTNYYDIPIPTLLTDAKAPYSKATKALDKLVGDYDSLDSIVEDSYAFSQKIYKKIGKYLKNANSQVSSFNSSITDLLSYSNIGRDRLDSIVNEMKIKAQDPNNTKLIDLITSIPKDIWDIRATLNNLSKIDKKTTFDNVVDMFGAEKPAASHDHKNMNDVASLVKQFTGYTKKVQNRLDQNNLTIANVLEDAGVQNPEKFVTKIDKVIQQTNQTLASNTPVDVANLANISAGQIHNVTSILQNSINTNSFNLDDLEGLAKNVGIHTAEAQKETPGNQQAGAGNATLASQNKKTKIIVLVCVGVVAAIGIIFVIVFVAKKKCHEDDEALI